MFSAPAIEEECGVRVVFTGRRGSSGGGSGTDLNLSYRVGDDTCRVSANREAVANAVGAPVERWVLCGQVHGSLVARVSRLDAGRGGRDHWSAIPGADGLLTGCGDLAIGVLTADCVPVIIVDTRTPSIAVIHAGWRGVLAGIAAGGARMLISTSGVTAEGLLAFIGPHIRSCCMEVGPEVVSLFEAGLPASCVRRTGERATLDLRAAVTAQLECAGMDARNVYDSGVCTRCSPDHFSFREDPGCGRQVALALITAEDNEG